MQEFVRKGTSLVFVSHNMTAVGNLCNQALLLKRGQQVYQGDVSRAVQIYHSFYEEEMPNKELELLEVHLRDSSGEERDIFEPGETVELEVRMRALKDIRNAHAAVLIHTADGQLVFDTATSRLTDQRLNLNEGETARTTFSLTMNLRSEVFLLGFTITSEIEVKGQFMYHNACLKRVVMRGDRSSNGIVHLDPRAELVIEAPVAV
jgi:ABC-type multidrug transport system ATPase subunit